MTPDELEKEAERIANLFYENLDDTEIVAENLRALRAVHAQGFAEGIEKAAKVSDRRTSDRYSSDSAVEAELISDEIRALKIGDGK